LLLYSSKPSLGVFQLAGYLLHIPTSTWSQKFLSLLSSIKEEAFTPSSPSHQQVFWRHCRGTKKKKNKKLPHQLGASKTSTSFLAPLPGRKKTSARGVSHAHPLLCFKFYFTLFLLALFYQKHKKLVSFIVVFTCLLLVLLE
jgi:hypothetical protein